MTRTTKTNDAVPPIVAPSFSSCSSAFRTVFHKIEIERDARATRQIDREGSDFGDEDGSQPGRGRSKRTAPVRRVRPVDVARAFHRAATRDAMQAVTHRAAAGPTAVARRASAPFDIARAVPGCHRQLDAAVPARVSSRRAFRRGGSRRGAVSVNAAHFEAVQAISDLAAGVGLPCTVRPPSTARRAQSRRRDRGSRRVPRRFRRRADRRRGPLFLLTSASASARPPAFHDTDPKLR